MNIAEIGLRLLTISGIPVVLTILISGSSFACLINKPAVQYIIPNDYVGVFKIM